jgi:hypothetical protein
MSGETASPTLDWVVSIGSILGIVATLTVVAAAAWRIIAVIRKKVTENVIANRDEARSMFARVEKQMQSNEELLKETIESKVVSGRQRYDDMKFWVEKIQAQVEQNRQEVDRNRMEIYKRIEQGDAANQKILDKINDLVADVARIKGMIALANGALAKLDKENNTDNK